MVKSGSLIPFHSVDINPLYKIETKDNLLFVEFDISSSLDKIKLNFDRPKLRTMGLWEETCFELFLLNPNTNQYIELNFSPTLAFNCFSFSSYRKDMKEIDFSFKDCKYNNGLFNVTLDLLEHQNFTMLGINLVVVDLSGKTHYFALKHGAEKPDFHAPSNFHIKI